MIDYLTYDEFGLKEVRCMNCNTVIAARSYTEVPSRTEINVMVKVMALKRLSNYRMGKKIKIKRGGIGGYVEPLICAGCVGISLTDEEIVDTIQAGIEKEWQKVKGKTDTEMVKEFKNKKIKLDKKL